MSRTFHKGDRPIRVKGIRRQPADLRRLARALIDLAQAEAEAAALAEHESTQHPVRAGEEPADNEGRQNGKDGT